MVVCHTDARRTLKPLGAFQQVGHYCESVSKSFPAWAMSHEEQLGRLSRLAGKAWQSATATT